MEIIYRTYVPDMNFEDFQAQIFNASIAGSRAAPVTAEQIKHRYETEHTDPQGVRYALTADGRPLAYVQTRVTSKPEPRTWIGYPWAMPDCPPEVQETLWEETYQYIKERDLESASERKVVMCCVQDPAGKHNAFARTKGFEEEDRASQYFIDVQKAGQIESPLFDGRIANENDLDLLVELAKVDEGLSQGFPDEDAMISYFKDRVLPDGHTVVLFNQKGQIVASGAPLHGYVEDGVLIRFSATRPGFESALKTLLVEIARHCLDQGWSALPLLFGVGYGAPAHQAVIAEELGATAEVTNVLFAKMIKKQ
ncbi:MAG: hypothetical protein ACXAEL_09465 [Candidatus Hodarchaeales archaeon]|jgi:hypothetical protein